MLAFLHVICLIHIIAISGIKLFYFTLISTTINVYELTGSLTLLTDRVIVTALHFSNTHLYSYLHKPTLTYEIY